MKPLYIETSAILCWLFGEPDSGLVINALNNSDIVITSVLSIIETERVLIRAETGGLITSGEKQRLKGIFHKHSLSWNFLEINESVRKKASMPFPVEPVKSLDAIHLATALEFLIIYPDLVILSFDKRIVDNIIPSGLQSVS